jgi:hypothetical protein
VTIPDEEQVPGACAYFNASRLFFDRSVRGPVDGGPPRDGPFVCVARYGDTTTWIPLTHDPMRGPPLPPGFIIRPVNTRLPNGMQGSYLSMTRGVPALYHGATQAFSDASARMEIMAIEIDRPRLTEEGLRWLLHVLRSWLPKE